MKDPEIFLENLAKENLGGSLFFSSYTIYTSPIITFFAIFRKINNLN